MNNCLKRWLVSALLPGAMIFSSAAYAEANWLTAGGDLTNSRNQPAEREIASGNVAGLLQKWMVETSGDVTANPAVDGNFLYFPDSAGFLYKVDREGNLIWKSPVASYTGVAGDFARATPAVVGDLLIMGNQAGKFLGAGFQQSDPSGAKVFAVDKHTGELRWTSQVDETAMSYVTHSAIAANGLVIVGVASNEELVAGFIPKEYWNWHFRGSVVALNAQTGDIVWRTYTVPQGYYGGAVWGSTGAIDLKRSLVYMATGNNYWVPQSVYDCLNNKGIPKKCMSADNHFNSIIALDLSTGAIKWARRGLPYDAWNVGCGLFVPGFTIPPNNNCPNPKGPDWDFAQGPILMEQPGGMALVGAGQKSGMFWAFHADDGAAAWNTQVAPGGLTGGLQWGSAYDGKRIYVAVANAGPILGAGQDAQPWKLKDRSVTTAGAGRRSNRGTAQSCGRPETLAAAARRQRSAWPTA